MTMTHIGHDHDHDHGNGNGHRNVTVTVTSIYVTFLAPVTTRHVSMIASLFLLCLNFILRLKINKTKCLKAWNLCRALFWHYLFA